MTNKERLSEHNARLSAIKAKLESGGAGGNTGGGSSGNDFVGNGDYDVTINFYDTDENPMYMSGVFQINNHVCGYFENVTSITVPKAVRWSDSFILYVTTSNEYMDDLDEIEEEVAMYEGFLNIEVEWESDSTHEKSGCRVVLSDFEDHARADLIFSYSV